VEVEYVDTIVDTADGVGVVVITGDGLLTFPLPVGAVPPERVLALYYDYPAVDLPVGSEECNRKQPV